MNSIAYTNFRNVPEAESATERKIRGYGAFEAGWHNGEGEAFAPLQVHAALAVYRNLVQLGFSITDAFPGMNGQILVAAYKDRHGTNYYVEYAVEKDRSVSLIIRKNGAKTTSRFHTSEGAAWKELVDLRGEIWTTSVWSTRSTVLIGGEKGSTATPSDWAGTVVFP